MEEIAIGINLSSNMISDVKHNRNIIVLLESCESLTSDHVDQEWYTIYRRFSRKHAKDSFGMK